MVPLQLLKKLIIISFFFFFRNIIEREWFKTCKKYSYAKKALKFSIYFFEIKWFFFIRGIKKTPKLRNSVVTKLCLCQKSPEHHLNQKKLTNYHMVKNTQKSTFSRFSRFFVSFFLTNKISVWKCLKQILKPSTWNPISETESYTVCKVAKYCAVVCRT